MPPIPERVRQAFEAGRLAHLSTVDPDGGPQVSCVWVGVEGDELVTAHLGAWRKVRNVSLDPRVALSVETGGTNQFGLAEYVVVYGRARIQEGGAPELLQRLAYAYIGPGVRFPAMPNPPPGYVLRITPERYVGVGQDGD